MKQPNILSVVAHWASAWAMLLTLYFGLSAVYGYGPRQATFVAHAYAGLTVLGLVVVRLFLRTLLTWPEDESAGSRILKLVAEGMHWTLYALMLLTPLTGWIVVSKMECCVIVSGLPNIDLLGPNLPIGRPVSAMTAYHVHIFFVWALLALISLHVMAALFHHFIIRDKILVRMMPVLGRRPGPVSHANTGHPNVLPSDKSGKEER